MNNSPEIPAGVETGSPQAFEIAPVADLRTRVQYLAVSLDFLGRASSRDGFISRPRSGESGTARSQDNNLPEAKSKAARNRNHFLIVARNEFKHAYEVSNDATEAQNSEFLEAWGKFHGRFAGIEHTDERNQQRRNYKKLLLITGPTPRGDKYSVQDQDTEPDEFLNAEDEVGDTLDTREKLTALMDDKRAGFLPATNREKNQALTLLDYMNESDKYPANIGHQFQEVFVHQMRLHGDDTDVARRALLSIGYEFSDYYEQALEQSIALADLAERINDCPNPRVSLLEEIGPDHPGYAPFIRYLDISALFKGRLSPVAGDPLLTREDRASKQRYAEKNKTVEDQYTSKQPSDKTTDYIQQRVGQLTIGELRKIIVVAQGNELKRADFWLQRLYDSHAHMAVWEATKQVLSAHGLLLKRPRVS